MASVDASSSAPNLNSPTGIFKCFTIFCCMLRHRGRLVVYFVVLIVCFVVLSMRLSVLTCLFRVIEAFPAHHSCFVGFFAGFRRCFSISDLLELHYDLPKGMFIPVDVSVDHLHYMLIDHQITFVLIRFQRDCFPAFIGHESVRVDHSLVFGNLMHMILNHLVCMHCLSI